MNQTERRRRIEQALGETIAIIDRYAAKGEEWLQLSGEGEIMARYEQHREKLLGYLAVETGLHEEAQLQARLERLRDALQKIANGWPCETAEAMRLVARDALGAMSKAPGSPRAAG